MRYPAIHAAVELFVPVLIGAGTVVALALALLILVSLACAMRLGIFEHARKVDESRARAARERRWTAAEKAEAQGLTTETQRTRRRAAG